MLVITESNALYDKTTLSNENWSQRMNDSVFNSKFYEIIKSIHLVPKPLDGISQIIVFML